MYFFLHLLSRIWNYSVWPCILRYHVLQLLNTRAFTLVLVYGGNAATLRKTARYINFEHVDPLHQLVDNPGLQVERYLDIIMKYLTTVLGTLILANAVLARRAGPPLIVGDAQRFNQICVLMTPLHGANAAQPGNGGYMITTDLPFINATAGYSYVAGQNATGTEVIDRSTPFRRILFL